MQQAYVQILSGRAGFDGRSSPKTFALGVVRMLAGGATDGSRRGCAWYRGSRIPRVPRTTSTSAMTLVRGGLGTLYKLPSAQRRAHAAESG